MITVMNAARRILGWLAIVLGSLGILVSIAGAIVVWIVSQKIGASVDRLGNEVSTFLSRIEQRSDGLGDRLGEAQANVTAVETKAGEAVSGRLGMEPGELRELSARISGYIERTRDWLAVAESTSELVQVFRSVIESAGAVTGAESRSDLADALAAGRKDIAEARQAVGELQAALEELESGATAADADPQKLSPLGKCAAALEKLEDRTRAFSGRLRKIDGGIKELRRQIKQQLFVGSLLVTLLLGWHGLAQAALTGWGRRRVRQAD
ncbi:hypothetical protein HAHE_07150 [Haloferula helveola]|uniref:Methyl-accepting chemotaxis protein n=1 Tax=Haloferula helveola TaxID=490095 RepID=A0ABM7RIG5_9BACT|nr:hypothetical protein HAHE_07150 [Haloferula helveola]